MRIEIDIPDWTKERSIYVFAGIELVAYRVPKEKWKVKTSRCNMCGKCCMDVPDKWSMGKNKETGHCVHLIFYANQWLCDLGSNRPFSCCIGDGADDCSIKWKEIN